MKFSVKIQYGLQAAFELALNHGGGPVQISDIAKSQQIPIRFLEQILLILKRQGIVNSTRGARGGYLLAKNPGEISVLTIIEALDGPIELAVKSMKKLPVLYEAIEGIQDKLKKDLADLTLEDLIFRKRQKDQVFTYVI